MEDPSKFSLGVLLGWAQGLYGKIGSGDYDRYQEYLVIRRYVNTNYRSLQIKKEARELSDLMNLYQGRDEDLIKKQAIEVGFLDWVCDEGMVPYVSRYPSLEKTLVTVPQSIRNLIRILIDLGNDEVSQEVKSYLQNFLLSWEDYKELVSGWEIQVLGELAQLDEVKVHIDPRVIEALKSW